MTPHEWARQFAEQGIAVHPDYWTETDVDDEGREIGEVCACQEGAACKSAGKHPIVSTKDSSTDEAQIDRWWEEYPYANLGVNTGGLTVVDVDFRHGGLESYRTIEAALPPTLRVRTGNGFHEYYRGEVGKAGGKLLKGIDFKSGATQQVVGPGSTHWTGAEYEVATDVPIAPLPNRITELSAQRAASEPAGTSVPVHGEMIHVGEGNDALVAAAGFFANHSRTYDELVGHLFALSEASMDVPASRERLEEIARNRWANHDKKFIDPTLGAALMVRTRQGVLTLRQLMELPSPEWEIRDLIPSGGITVLYGDGGTKKSFVALDWALTAGIPGMKWHDYELRRRRTMYVAAEGVSGMPDRIRAWANGHQLDLEEVLESGVLVYPQAINLASPDATAAIVEVLQEASCDRIVVDTLRRAMPGGDENSTQDIGRVVDACARINAEAEADVLLIHHSPATADRPRGNTTIRDDADVVLGMRRATEGGAYVSSLRPSKLKDAAEFDPLVLTFRAASLEEEGEEPRSSLFLWRVGHDEDEVGNVRHVAVAHHELMWTAIQGAAMAGEREWTRARLAELQAAPRNTMTRSLARLEEGGQIERVGHGLYRIRTDT